MTAAPTKAPPVDALALLAGTLRDERSINERMEEVAQKCILISPATTCTLQPGCAVSFNLVRIDGPKETYEVDKTKGWRALGRTALFKLANAAGISWNGSRSYRVDDGTNAHYCHWHAEGAWMALDGSVMPVDGDCQMDLREGSKQTQKIRESATGGPQAAERQLRDAQAKVLERAQTGAQLRGIRKALALDTYTLKDLAERPFMVARVYFDGYDEDPAVMRDNKAAIRDRMLGGARALFGVVAAKRLVRGVAPPEVGSVPADEDDWMELPERPVRAPWEERPAGRPPPAQPPPPATPAATPPAASRPAPAGERSGLVIPGGRARGTPIEDAVDDDLLYWTKKIDGGLRAGTSWDKARDQKLHDAMMAVLDARIGKTPAGGDAGGCGGKDDEIPF